DADVLAAQRRASEAELFEKSSQIADAEARINAIRERMKAVRDQIREFTAKADAATRRVGDADRLLNGTRNKQSELQSLIDSPATSPDKKRQFQEQRNSLSPDVTIQLRQKE